LANAHAYGCQILLPHDALVSTGPDGEPLATPCMTMPPDMMMLDIGPATVLRLTSLLADCSTVLWNGPVGFFEKPAFASGTLAIARLIAQQTKSGRMTSIAGGGDTVAALQLANVADDFTYVSTAGGAFLEFLEGRILPGIAALEA
jgi:phosphoglycerate kinase